VSGRPTLQAPYRPLLPSTPHAAAPFCYHCPLERTYPACAVACADDVEAVMEREGPGTVAAVIAEPVIGASAASAVPPPEYLPRVAEACRRHGVLLIADEVMSGFGRTGRWFAVDHDGVAPDIVTCGKGMTSGYAPVGAVLASDGVVDAVKGAGGFVHGFTFSHHPVTAAAALAVLDILERERLVERAAGLGPVLEGKLAPLRQRRHVGDVRGRGLMWGVELVEDRAARKPFPRARRTAERVAERALGLGLVVYPTTGIHGLEGDALMVAPPFVATEAELDEMAGLLAGALDAEGLA
jgi:hypothetical protein